ncbi:MAG TPA: hypothetical protein VKN18_11915 [Blastocatellia bacterium]|nr:hypothetical protein [Blastocatellia bacterium]
MQKGWQYKGAFVIQFRPDSDVGAGHFEGRVEHVSSHRSMRFQTLEELLRFMASVLDEARKMET